MLFLPMSGTALPDAAHVVISKPILSTYEHPRQREGVVGSF